MSLAARGSKNHQWKGNGVHYAALHEWVRKNFGQPPVCEDCGKKNLFGQSIHWANISGQYKRVRSDWKRLCPKCHRKLADKRSSLTVAVNGNVRIRELKQHSL